MINNKSFQSLENSCVNTKEQVSLRKSKDEKDILSNIEEEREDPNKE